MSSFERLVQVAKDAIHGVPDERDALPFDPTESVDTDGDGTGNNADPDDNNDGLSDVDELDVYGTNPLRRDTDGDGLGDGDEITNGLNPLDPEDCPRELCPAPSSLLRLIVPKPDSSKARRWRLCAVSSAAEVYM
jgi:hypothetical protein